MKSHASAGLSGRYTYAAVMALLLGLGGLGGCQFQQQAVAQHENDLAAAGFIVRIANTAERQAMLNRLPPNQFVRRVNGTVVHYVYADPDCGCLYVGPQQAYDRYRSNQQLDFVGQEKLAAQTFYDAAWNWGAWGPWGPLGPVYGPDPGF